MDTRNARHHGQLNTWFAQTGVKSPAVVYDGDPSYTTDPDLTEVVGERSAESLRP